MPSIGAVARDGALMYAGSIAVLGLGFVLRVLLARALSPFDLGLFLAAQTIVTLGQTTAQLSLPEGVVRFVGVLWHGSVAKARAVLTDALQMSVVAGLVVVVILIVLARPLSTVVYDERRLAGVLICLALAIPFAGVSEILAAAARGTGRAWIKVICVDLGRILFILLGLAILLGAGLRGLLAIALVHLVGTAAAGLVTYFAFRRDTRWAVQAKGHVRKDLLHYSVPLLANGFASWPCTLIPLWLGSLVSPGFVSYFALAGALSNFIYMPVIALDFAILPLWGRMIGDGNWAEMNRLYAYVTRWCVILGSLVFVPLFFCPVAVLVTLYGPAYAEGAPVLRMVAVTIMAGTITGTSGSLLRAFGRTRWVLTGTAIGGLIALGAYPMILRFGAAGGIAMFSAAQLVGIGLYSLFLYFGQGIHPVDKRYLKTLLAGAGALGGVALLRPFVGDGISDAFTITAAFALMLGSGLVLLRALDEQDLRLMKRVFGFRDIDA